MIVCDDGKPRWHRLSIAERVGRELGHVEGAAPAGSNRAWATCTAHGFRTRLDGGADVIVADGRLTSPHHPRHPRTWSNRLPGADVVIGSRYVPCGAIPDWPHLPPPAVARRQPVRAATCSDSPIRDATSGNAGLPGHDPLRQTVVGTNPGQRDGFHAGDPESARLTGAGARSKRFPSSSRDRVAGASKMSARIRSKTLLLVTWWGVSARFPGAARTLRSSPAGQRLSDLAGRLS